MLVKWDQRIWTDIYGPTLRFIMRETGALRIRRKGIQRGRRVSLREYLRGFTVVPRKVVLLWRYGVPRVR